MVQVAELALNPGSSPVRVSNLDVVYEEVASIQKYAFLRHHLAKRNLQGGDDVVQLDLCTPNNSAPRYQLYVCDRQTTSITPLAFAIFIVPKGRETEWLFGNPEGRKQLAESCGAERLIVVHLNRNHSYTGLDEVKQELSQKVMELAPPSHKEGREVRQFGYTFILWHYAVNMVVLLYADFQSVNFKPCKLCIFSIEMLREKVHLSGI